MTCLHKFAAHPELRVLFCVRCGDLKEIAGAQTEDAPKLRPVRPRSPRRRKQDPAAAAEADLARRIMELPLGEVESPELEQIVETFNRAREEQNIPVVDDDRIGTGTGL